jgi:Bacteriophage tail sheath protein
MPEYLSPGVYVEEVPPLARPIAGVGTSTAGFIGLVPSEFEVPVKRVTGELVKGADGTKTELPLLSYPVLATGKTFKIRVDDEEVPAQLLNEDPNKVSKVKFETAPSKDATIKADYVTVSRFQAVDTGKPILCTNFGEFAKSFGDFSNDGNQQMLAHSVHGFFNNGGTRCYVMRFAAVRDIQPEALDAFGAIDEIAIVAAPGIVSEEVQEMLIDHCESLGDRFAVLDGAQQATKPEFTKSKIQGQTKDSSHAAIYFPWIRVTDFAGKLVASDDSQSEPLFVAPSGHIAGVYAQVDGDRGVHKAPANVVIRGALDVQHPLTKSHQDGLNPQGINCIRNLNGNIYVWGARTMGGDANGEFKHISTRRLMNFLRESIEEGTQFVVFEPNNPGLWQRIKRSVGDFLLGQWRDGALFGDTPDKAFFVKCDAETNPPDVRESGKVVTEIGVAVVKPAEFVIFRIQQQTGG